MTPTSYAAQLTLEAVVVGVVLALIGVGAARLAPKAHPGLRLFAIGAATHLVFEATGLNRRYCGSGAACRATAPARAPGGACGAKAA